MNDSTSPPPQPAAPRWQPINLIDRRVAGVLVEKAKTVPSAYPMSLNAIATAANQKNNRFPVVQLEPEQVEESLERLRQLGAVGLIQGYGRVAKYRHYLYEWLGVDKVELAVMAELLLRGAQTEGELRSRAARMEPILDLAALRPVLASLRSKGLVVSLSPEGRGHVITHALYPPRELEGLKAQFAAEAVPMAGAPGEDEYLGPAHALGGGPAHDGQRVPGPVGREGTADAVAPLRRQVEDLAAQVAELRGDLDKLASSLQETQYGLSRLKDALGS
jgi:uncharacterized protein YceH (UPF0502 family)